MFDKFEKIRRSGLKLFDITDLSIILNLRPESIRVIATRMVKKGLLTRLKRDLYLLSGAEIDKFEIANKLITPSYISFESALNYWEITTQIPASVTSAARRSKKISALGDEFLFSNLPKKLFNFGIVREKTFFIADPEKTFLDMAYYASMGKKSVTFDILDLSKINKTKLERYLDCYPKQTRKTSEELL